MTRTNNEIRTEIARALCYLPFPNNMCPVCGFPYSDKHCQPGDCSVRPPPDTRADECYPNWPEDDLAALKLWYGIPGYKAIEFLDLQEDGQRYRVTITDGLVRTNFYGPTLALAICVAWILWYRARNSQKGAKQ